jgi:hypothetical protein
MTESHAESGLADPARDCRLYVRSPAGWKAHILTSGERMYCFAKLPGQDYYHLILDGEIYLQNGNESYCLQCALREGILTLDRLHWQRRDLRQ